VCNVATPLPDQELINSPWLSGEVLHGLVDHCERGLEVAAAARASVTWRNSAMMSRDRRERGREGGDGASDRVFETPMQDRWDTMVHPIEIKRWIIV
jgi:hypothetical protein